MEKIVIEMWTSKKPAFEKKIARLNKVLKRHGKNPFTYHYENEHSRTVTFTHHMKGDAYANDKEIQVSVPFCKAVVEGEATIKKDDKDYRYIGSVRIENGVKQLYCNDKEFESAFLNFRDGICDHCGTKRMNRKSYFLFESDGSVVQIGSTCVREYLGMDSAEYLKCMEDTFITFSDGDDDFWGERGPSFSDDCGISYAMAYSFVDYATMGFQKWTKASEHESSTMDDVHGNVNAYFLGKYEMIREGHNAIQMTRDECLEYWKKQPISTFTQNIINALEADAAYSRSLGTYCYGIYGAVNAKMRAQMETIERTSVPCKFEVGQRVNITGKIISIKTYEVENFYSYYGGTILKKSINFQDVDGTLYHFNTGSTTFNDVKDGDDVEIRGKILETKEWKGVMYTGLDTPKCVKVLSATQNKE